MRKLIYIFLLFSPALVFGQIVKTAAVPYTKGTTPYTPNVLTSSEIRVDTACSCLYWWDRDNLTWIRQRPGADVISGSAPPAYTPRDNQSLFAVNADSELFYYDGSVWNQIGGGGGLGGIYESSDTVPDGTVATLEDDFAISGGNISSITISTGTTFGGQYFSNFNGASISFRDTTGSSSLEFSSGGAAFNFDDGSTDRLLINDRYAQYGGDYSAGYNARSIPDVGYVDGLVNIPATEVAYGTGTGITSSANLTYSSPALTNSVASAAAGIHDTGASSSSSGGLLTLANFDGAAINTNHRLGSIRFSGATNGSGGTATGATIDGISSSNWSGTNAHSRLEISTPTVATHTLVPRFRVTDGEIAVLNGEPLNLYTVGNTLNAVIEVNDSTMYVIPPGTSTNEAFNLYGKIGLYGCVGGLTGNIDNYYLACPGAVLEIGGSAHYTVSGMQSSMSGVSRLLFIRNSGTDTITLLHNSVSSDAENRFDIESDYNLLPGQVVTLLYIDVLEKWTMPNRPGGGDWGSQVVETEPRLTGDGTSGDPLDIAQQGATAGQVLKWDGTDWSPQADGTGIALGAANTIFGVNGSGTSNEYKAISGTANQVNLAHGTGTITLSTPQDIHTGASPTFDDLTVTDDLNVGDNLTLFGTTNILSIEGTSLSYFNMSGPSSVLIGDGGTNPIFTIFGLHGEFFTSITPSLAFNQTTKKSASGTNTRDGPIVLTYMNDGSAIEAGHAIGAAQYASRGTTPTRETAVETVARAVDTWTGTSIPGQYVFRTVPRASKVLVDRMTLNHSGELWFMGGNGTRYYDSDNSNSVTLRPPATDSLTSNYTLQFPRTPGTNGQVLKIRQDSVLYFADDLTGGGGGSGHVIYDDGSSMTDRDGLDFVSGSAITFALTDNAGGNKTEVRAGIGTGAVGSAELENLGSAGSCNNCNITVDVDGRVSAHSSGFPRILRPAQITAARTDNYSPTGYSTTQHQTLILNVDDFNWLTGLAAATRDGIEKTFSNKTRYCVGFARLNSNSTAGNRFNFEHILFPGAECTVRYDSVEAKWDLKSVSESNEDNYLNMVFASFQDNITTLTVADNERFNFVTNSGALAAVNASSDRPRAISFSTSTSAASFPTFTSKSATTTGWIDSKNYYKVSTYFLSPAFASDGTQDYDIRIGFDATADVNQTEGAFVTYDKDVNGGNWTLHTNDGTNTSNSNTGVAFATSTKYLIDVVYYPFGEVACFITTGGVVTSISKSTHIPDAVGVVPTLFQIDKNAGTTARLAFLINTFIKSVNSTH